MSKTIAHTLLLAVCLSAAPHALAATQERPAQDRPAQDRPAQDRPAQDRPAQDRPAQDRPAQGTEQSREQAAREQQAREQAAREQQGREEAARQQQHRIGNAREQQQQQQQEQERIRNARGNGQEKQRPETLFAKFKEEASKHRDSSARINALRRIANARQNQERVAELDQMLARENNRYSEWVRRTRNELGADEFESQQARIDGRAVRRTEGADATRRTREANQSDDAPQRR